MNVIKEEAEKQQEKPVLEKAESGEVTKKLPLDSNIEEQEVVLGSNLSEEEKQKLIGFLRSNKDVFAWSTKDLCGNSRGIIEHSLCVNPSAMLKRRVLRKMSEDRAEGAKSEVFRLLEAGVIRPIDYAQRLTNVVMVKKANGKWRMCIDFTDLNKACLKDEFPLPRIDALIDATV